MKEGGKIDEAIEIIGKDGLIDQDELQVLYTLLNDSQNIYYINLEDGKKLELTSEQINQLNANIKGLIDIILGISYAIKDIGDIDFLKKLGYEVKYDISEIVDKSVIMNNNNLEIKDNYQKIGLKLDEKIYSIDNVEFQTKVGSLVLIIGGVMVFTFVLVIGSAIMSQVLKKIHDINNKSLHERLFENILEIVEYGDNNEVI